MSAPTEEQVQDALADLGNTVELAQCELVSHFPRIAAIEPLNDRARSLRSLLLKAIEALGPARPAPFGSAESRAVDVLTLRYIERMNTADMAEELSLSRRQVQRDLRRAEGLLITLLASWVCNSGSAASDAASQDQLGEELALFSSRPAQVQVSEIVQGALATVGPLADSLRVRLRLHEAGDRVPFVVADRAFLGQLLVQAISFAIQSASSGEVGVRVLPVDDLVEVEISFRTEDSPEAQKRLEMVRRAAVAEAIRCQVDNPGAVDLYRRYLMGSGCEVRAISDPRICYQSVRTNRPDVVVLDIMMPHLDGWRVLRTLKESPETEGTPVIVCSVVEDPALAQALGATAYLRKPVSQADFLTALSQCLRSLQR